MEIFENLYDWILEHKKWFVRAVKFLNALLMLAATVLSGVAAWYSFRAAEEANATAKQANATATAAYKFTIRSANDSNALQQPSLSVTSGKIVQEETLEDGPWKMKSTRYSVELHVLNSGLRDAAAVWVALGDDRGSAWTQAQKPATISKGQDLLVNFEVKTSDTQLKDLRTLTVNQTVRRF